MSQSENRIKLLFVCTGNICRSPLAHALFQNMVDKRGLSERYEIESAGTYGYHIGEDADSRMRATSAARGVPFSHGARKLSRRDLGYYDHIFAMDRGHFREIQVLADGQSLDGKLHMFRRFDPLGGPREEVPDPYYGGQDGFELVYDMVERTCESLLNELEEGRL